MLDILYVPFFLGINMSHEGDIMYVGFAEPESYPMVPRNSMQNIRNISVVWTTLW